ncbi:MAG TPA: hypothetical protein VK034_29465 [Enhygromyxa sp.]|nr:hypothetical protein [Enhygromyxa sp.]
MMPISARDLGAAKLELCEQLREQFLGPELAALIDQPGFAELVSLTWEQCSIVAARIAVPDWSFEGPDAREVLRAIVQSPAAASLRELTLGLFNYAGGGLEDVALDIIAGGVLTSLERLFIGDFEREQQEISWVELGDISPLYPFAPRLQNLRLRGAAIGLGELGHPTLAQLEIETGGLPRDSVVSVATAELPALAYLEVWFGREDYGGTTDITALRPIFSSKTLPALRHLGLQNSEMQDLIAIELAGSPLLAQIESADLSMGTMREPGARALLDNAAAFEHLLALNLEDNYIPQQLCAQLLASFGHVVECGRQRAPEFDDGDAIYYASVGE